MSIVCAVLILLADSCFNLRPPWLVGIAYYLNISISDKHSLIACKVTRSL